MRRPKLIWLYALAVGVLASRGVAQIRLPDPATGVINGRDATAVWPARYEGGKVQVLLPADGCRAHFVARDDPDNDRVYPCGQWLLPSIGKYRVWLEGKDFISPFPLAFTYIRDAFDGRGRSMLAPVVPAGFVTLSDDAHATTEQGLRLLSLNPSSDVDKWPCVFERRVAKPTGPAIMPEGVVLAGLFDRSTNDAIALSRPVAVRAGQTVVVRPTPPQDQSDVLVVLDRPRAPERDELRLSLKSDEKTRQPDVLLHAADAVFGVWYGVPGRDASLVVESKTLTLGPVTLSLRPNHVTTFRGSLRKKPRLTVSVIAPADLFKQMRIVLRRIHDRSPLREIALSGPGEQIIDSVPPERLRVTLTADQWEFNKDVDLTDGSDGQVSFLLEPIVVHGTVYLGKEAAPGRIAFEYAEHDQVTAETDERGEYHATFWSRGIYFAKVTLVGDPAAPFIDPVDIEHDGTLDVHLPNNRILARVIDARSGKPIADATINVFTEASHNVVGDMALGQRYVVDDGGRLVLPRLRPGRVTIGASATGYARSDPQVIEIGESTERDITFTLTRLDTVRSHVVLPSGSPAAGAEALVMDAVGRDVLWRGTAGADGNLEIGTAGIAGLLIVRHPQAAAMARSLSSVGESLLLAPADPMPLTVRSTDSSGNPVRFALLALWIDGIRLSDQPAAFAAWSNIGMTDVEGLWIGRNLPAVPLRMLATKRLTPVDLATGAYDSLAQTIPYPRPREVFNLATVQ